MGKGTLTLAIIHSRIKLGARRANTTTLKRIIRELLKDSSFDIDTIVLPAYAFHGPVIGYYPEGSVKNAIRRTAERISKTVGSQSSLLALAKQALEHDVNILVGPMIERAGPRLYVTSVLINRYGVVTGKYRKIGVTPKEESFGINPGKEPGVFIVSPSGARLGVFIDEDLAYFEIFRMLQHQRVNFILGFMLPYPSSHFFMEQQENRMLTMNRRQIDSFLIATSIATGIPMVLVGGVVESHNHEAPMAYMDTIPVEPDIGVIEDRVKTYSDTNSALILEVDIKNSRARPVEKRIVHIYRKVFGKI